MCWGSSPHLLGPPVVRDVAVHEPADVVRHPADDIHSHEGSCRTGERQTDRKHVTVTPSLGKKLPKVTRAFPLKLLLESRGWKGTLR